MEPVTQGLLGAATGDLAAGRTLGRRALLWGALVGMSPDLDVVLAPLHDGFGEWIHHRGTTHSLWFGFAVGPPVALLLRRWQDPAGRTPRSAWIALVVAALVTHPLLDGFTPYGTQLLAPFSRERFVWNGVAIVDPFYSVLLGTGVWIAASTTRPPRDRRAALLVLVAVSSAYLGVGIAMNRWMEDDLRQRLSGAGLAIDRLTVYPTLLQPWLRHFVAHEADGGERIYTGLASLARPACPSWQTRRAAGSDPRARRLLETRKGAVLAWFADGELGLRTRPTSRGTRIRIDDLRYTWGSASGDGLWGIEAEVDARGRQRTPIRRFGRGDASGRDLTSFVAAIFGALPGEAEGWSRPPGCRSAPGPEPGSRGARGSGTTGPTGSGR